MMIYLHICMRELTLFTLNAQEVLKNKVVWKIPSCRLYYLVHSKKCSLESKLNELTELKQFFSGDAG